MSIHHGISCDFCRKTNFSAHRYKCLICNDFDLCANCYENKSHRSIQRHSIDHPMQLILTANDYEYIYYGIPRTTHSPMSFVCPLCRENGFSLEYLIKHIDENHSLVKSSVLCPICFNRQNQLLEHLYQHTQENFSIKIKKISTTNEKELKLIDKSTEQSFLERFLQTNPKKNDNGERNLFLQALLTDIVSRDIPMDHTT